MRAVPDPVEPTIHHRPRHLIWWMVAVVAVGATTTVVVVSARVPAWEASLTEAVAGWPDVLEAVLWPPMQLGTALAPVAVALVAWWGWRSWRPAVGALVVGIGGWWLAKVVKALVERGRPFDEIEGFVARGSAPTDGLGYLSGHATVAAGLATVMWPWLRRPWRWVVVGLAALVGVARVYVGAHLPLDVVGGACLGVLVGCAWNLAVGVPDERPRWRGGSAPPGSDGDEGDG